MTIRINIHMNDVGKIERRVAKIWKAEMAKAMRKAASMCKPILMANTANAPPASDSPRSTIGAVDQGGIIKNWEFLMDHGSLTVMIFNKTEHSGYAEEGVPANARKIGPLGQDLIESWMLRKGIVISDQKSGIPLSSKKAAKLLVFAINRREGQWRFKPRTMVKRSGERIQEIFDREIAAQMVRTLAKAAVDVVTTRRI